MLSCLGISTQICILGSLLSSVFRHSNGPNTWNSKIIFIYSLDTLVLLVFLFHVSVRVYGLVYFCGTGVLELWCHSWHHRLKTHALPIAPNHSWVPTKGGNLRRGLDWETGQVSTRHTIQLSSLHTVGGFKLWWADSVQCHSKKKDFSHNYLYEALW